MKKQKDPAKSGLRSKIADIVLAVLGQTVTITNKEYVVIQDNFYPVKTLRDIENEWIKDGLIR